MVVEGPRSLSERPKADREKKEDEKLRGFYCIMHSFAPLVCSNQ